MPIQNHAEDFAYFYDTIHGRVSFSELPAPFLEPLRVALNSPHLSRLTRISQLGYTSLTFFSATQTRFSHAIGTLVMMHRLMQHLWGEGDAVPQNIVDAVRTEYPDALVVSPNEEASIRCHLLLAALMQDVGELPFQKITSHYFRPSVNVLRDLESRNLSTTSFPKTWKVKDVFTISCLAELLHDRSFNRFDLKFLTFLIIDRATSLNGDLLSLRQMLNGVVDADRLDYVYRDAHLTIGALTTSHEVIQTIVRYEDKRVVVDDPRPITDFLSTRARLWSFVYSSPAVRFRQTLLRSFLQAALADDNAVTMLREVGLPVEMSLQDFLKVDDHSFLASLREIETDSRLHGIETFGQTARKVMLKAVSDYECRILEKPDSTALTNRSTAVPPIRSVAIPGEAFFDLLSDHEEEHKLYTPDSVMVEQRLTQHLIKQPVTLERCSGALGSVFQATVSVPLVQKSFLLFLPEKGNRPPSAFSEIETAIVSDPISLHRSIDKSDVVRELVVPDDTWNPAPNRNRSNIAISCSFMDRETVLRITQALRSLGEPYRVLLDSLLWLGHTAPRNSEELIRQADAVFIVLSKNYINAWFSAPNGNIAIEAREMLMRKRANRKVVLPLLPYSELNQLMQNRWVDLDSNWTSAPIIVPDPLRGSRAEFRRLLEYAVKHVNS